MNLLQNIYILVFNTVFKLTKHINYTIREWIAKLCVFGLSSLFFVLMILTRQGITDIHVKGCTEGGIFLLILLCIFSVNKPLKKVKWNKWITYPYFTAAVYMTIMSFDQNPGEFYQSYAIMMLLILPALYFIWGNRKDYLTYYDWFAKSLIILGLLSAVATIMFAPISEKSIGAQYIGLTDNPNIFGMISISVTAASLYMIFLKRKFYVIYAVLAGVYATFIWLTVSRTAIFVLVMQVIAWLIITVRTYFPKEKVKSIAFVALTMVIMITSAFLTNTALQNDIVAEAKTETVMSENYQIADSEVDAVKNRFDFSNKSLEEFTSGRTDIWKWYIDKISWRGHDCTNHEVEIAPGVIYHNAHNTVLEISYRFGWPAGVAYAIFMLVMVVALIIGGLIRANRKYTIFIILLTIAYFIEAMLDVMTIPFERGPVLMFYMALIGVFEGDFLAKKDKNENKESSSQLRGRYEIG